MKAHLPHSFRNNIYRRFLLFIGCLGIAALTMFMRQPATADEGASGIQPETYDIIIENCRIIDGTGNPWYHGDVGIKNGRISKIGHLKESNAGRKIDAAGMFVTPGFIDIHTHSDRPILAIPGADNSVRQGLTTIVGGNCGGSPLPVEEFQIGRAHV